MLCGGSLQIAMAAPPLQLGHRAPRRGTHTWVVCVESAPEDGIGVAVGFAQTGREAVEHQVSLGLDDTSYAFDGFTGCAVHDKASHMYGKQWRGQSTLTVTLDAASGRAKCGVIGPDRVKEGALASTEGLPHAAFRVGLPRGR